MSVTGKTPNTLSTPPTPTDPTALPPLEQAFEWPKEAMRAKKWSEAACRWAILRKAYPGHPAPWFQGAIAHMEAGELDQADQLLIHCRKQFPSHPNSAIQSASFAIYRGDWQTAEEYLKQAREEYPEHVQTWLKSAQAAELRGDHLLADQYYRKAQECDPDRPISYIQHAEQAMRAEQWEIALERWEVVRERFPDVPAGYHRAAEAARMLNRTRYARKLLLAHQYGNEILLDSDETGLTENTPKRQLTGKRFGQFLSLIWTKARFNLRSEVQRNYLSYGWWILEPMLHMIVYYLVFGFLLNHGGKDYPIFLLTGLIPWMWFSKAISGSSNSILAGQDLMLQAGIHSLFFPLVSLLQATIKQIPVFLLLFGFLWLFGYQPDEHWLALLPVILVQAILIVAVGCGVAAIIPFSRDLSYLVPTGLMFLMFMSGIFYDYRNISDNWQELFLLNPLAFLLKSYREILMENIWPDFHTLGLWGTVSFLVCIQLLLAYRRLRYIYPRIVLQ